MISAAAGGRTGGRWTWRRVVSLSLLISLTPMLTGCTRWPRQEMSPDGFFEGDYDNPQKNRIVAATLTNGEHLEFERWPEGHFERDSLFGQLEDGPITVPVSEVERVWVATREFAPGRTVLAVMGVAAGAFIVALGVAAATKESCPFIYSWDGESWVFDAEPYGGATSEGLERADFTELEHLVAVDGEYRLMVTNEVNETQHTNMFELWAVEHAPGTRVVADEFGGLHAVRDPVPPSSAVDASGTDLLPWLGATDRRIWEHEPVPTSTGELRQEITLAFPKPEGATEARLIANVATGAWGSHMIREFYELRGTDLDAFHRELDTSARAREELFAWNLREELYTLKLRVEEPTGWEVRGLLPGGGPFIAEDRVVALDVSRVEGDELRIRIRPPVGFWALNSFQVDYGAGEPAGVVKLAPSLARTSEGEDVLPELTAVDDAYYAMPETGDWAELRFPAVEEEEGMERTFILHSRGYYRLHITPEGPPDRAAIREIEEVPDASVRRAVESYATALERVAGDGTGTPR